MRAVFLASVALFGLAAFVHVVRYVLLLINRTTLLPRLVANFASLFGVLASLAAVVAVVVTSVAATWWLIGRRSEAFHHRGDDDPRPNWALWAGCLIPLVNLVWAPVYVFELSHAENSYGRMRAPIATWWVSWLFAYLISIYAFATSFTTQPQGIADNTVSMVLAYLVGGASIALVWVVFDKFVRRPVERPLHRWVILGEGRQGVGGGEGRQGVGGGEGRQGVGGGEGRQAAGGGEGQQAGPMGEGRPATVEPEHHEPAA
jgi:hypothetical protein